MYNCKNITNFYLKSRSNRAEKQMFEAMTLITIKLLLTELFWLVSTRAKLKTDQKVLHKTGAAQKSKNVSENIFFQKT